jgi:hypothetical protein
MEQNTAINQGIIAPELISTPAKGALLCAERGLIYAAWD